MRGDEAGFCEMFVKAAALLLITMFVFHSQAYAGAQSKETPGELAALSLPGDSSKKWGFHDAAHSAHSRR